MAAAVAPVLAVGPVRWSVTMPASSSRSVGLPAGVSAVVEDCGVTLPLAVVPVADPPSAPAGVSV